MFSSLLKITKAPLQDNQMTTKRRHARRHSDKCIAYINGKAHPVQNWSMGGVLVNTDSRSFGVDNEIDLVLKFKLRDKMIDVPHRARVIRKSKDSVAFEFLPINDQMKHNFQNVIDDYVAGQFADSQI